MARDLTIVYAVPGGHTTTLGGSSGYLPVERMSRTWNAEGAKRVFEFAVEFLVNVTPTASKTADYASMIAKANLIESQLSERRGKLTVTLAGAAGNLELFDQTLATLSGYDPELSVSVVPVKTNTMWSQRYRWTVKYYLPAMETGQGGRVFDTREDHSYTIEDKREIVFSGTWTAVPGTAAYENYEASIEAFCQAWIVAHVSASATFEQVRDRPVANDANTEVSYQRVYWEHVKGRRTAWASLAFSKTRRKRVKVTGKYIKTGATTAFANYNDVTFGCDVYCAALIAANWPTPASYFELVQEEPVRFNEPNQSLDFDRLYQEVLINQVSGARLDPNGVFVDEKIVIGLNETQPGYSPDVQTGLYSDESLDVGGSSGSGATGTRDAAPLTSSGATPGGISGGISATPLVELTVKFECGLREDKLGTTVPMAYWNSNGRDYIFGLIRLNTGYDPVAINPRRTEVDITDNLVNVSMTCYGTISSVFKAVQQVAIDDDPGRIFKPAFTPKKWVYLIQQGFAKLAKTRELEIAYLAGAYQPSDFFLSDHADADGRGKWMRVNVRSSKPRLERIGVVGGPTITIAFVRIVEYFLLVAATVNRPTVAAGASGGGSPDAAPTTSK